ncbi:MAG: FtsX-like permease family protein [Candidatus Heimdallarchaeota archaeon]|nr:FtsX-like permease family protein [Candidatus Heimdallarchaeota archaeon]
MIKFELGYAIKSLSRRQKKNLAAVLSIALGVTLFTGVSTGINGLGDAFASNWINWIGDNDIYIEDPITDFFPEEITVLIERSSDPRLAQMTTVAPVIKYLDMPVYASGQFDKDIKLMGISTEDRHNVGYRDFFDLMGKVVDYQAALATVNSVMVNSYMAEIMEIQHGDLIQTALPVGDGSYQSVSLTVTAIYDHQKGRGQEEQFRDLPMIYVSLDTVRASLLPELQNQVNLVKILFDGVDKRLADLDVPGQSFKGKEMLQEAVAAIDEIVLDEMVSPSVWSERVIAADEIKITLDDFRAILNIFVFLLNATALLLIVNVQAMGMDDRRYQTAVLRSMGASRGSILRIFLIESMVVGFAGSLIGILGSVFYGNWINAQLSSIFDFNATSARLTTDTIISGIIFGMLFAVVTSIIPAWRSSGKPIASELRRVQSPKVEKNGRKTALLGIGLIAFGLQFAQNVGEFWTKDAWSTFESQTDIMLGLGMTFAGIGFLLTLFINRQKALNIAGLSIWGFAVFTMFIAIDWIEGGNANNWFTTILLYLVIGTAILTINNFEKIMRGLNHVLFTVTGFRAVAQTTTNQLIGKKSRSTLVFTIFTIILILNVFLTSAANTMQTNLVDQYEYRTNGVDVTVDTLVADDAIGVRIMEIDTVEHVYAFRSTFIDMYFMHPNAEDTLSWRLKVVEIQKSVINPDNDWNSENAFPITFDQASKSDGYVYNAGMSEEAVIDLSTRIWDDIFDHKTRDVTLDDDSVETQTLVAGGFFSDSGDRVYLRTADDVLPLYRAGSTVNFMGDWDGFGGSLLVTPQIASQLPEFDLIQGPNIFLVKSSNSYFDGVANLELSQAIEATINNLDDPTSLSSELGVLVGASTRIIEEVMQQNFDDEAGFWIFLASFATFGLIIGGAGMAVIAVRSVAERTREIGMMRAIGFSRQSIVASVVLEMLTLATIGLISGIINGVLLMEMFADKIIGTKANYPLGQLGFFAGLIILLALIAAIIPGYRASRITPSQALRYTG